MKLRVHFYRLMSWLMQRKKSNKPATDSKFGFGWFAQRTLCNVTPVVVVYII